MMMKPQQTILFLNDRVFLLTISAKQWINTHIRKGSILWNILKGIYRTGISIRENPIRKKQWLSNEKKFRSLVELLSQNNPDFFVIQVGACDGVMDDPIHKWIDQYHWNGILIEPQDDEFQNLVRNYSNSKQLHLVNAAITAKDGSVTLYKVKNDEKVKNSWQRGTASLIPQSELTTSVVVKSICFQTLFEKYGVSHVELLQIDVEGFDYEIIKLFDFKQIKPALLRYEHRHLSPSNRRECVKLLCGLGYKIIYSQYDTSAVLIK
jgi:FkbM family methyltransferase